MPKRPITTTPPAGDPQSPEPVPQAPAPSKPKLPPKFESFSQARAFLDSRLNVEALRPAQVDAESAFNLERMRALVGALGNPQESFLTVHVAGSKGKGSVCEMLASVLSSCKCTVGLYTSPHLVTLRERIRLQGRMIEETDFCRLLGAVALAAEGLPNKKLGDATYFELLTAMAYLHFAEQAVDVGVIEVGMGGTSDATNVITPAVSVITAIQKEHTQILGNSLAQIAQAKAGIIKPAVPVYTLPQSAEVMGVLEERALAVGAPLRVLGKNIEFSFRLESSPQRGLHAKVCLTGSRGVFEHLAVPLHGEHQAQNCGLVLGVVDALRERGFDCPDGLVADGLGRTPLNGRLERVSDSPPIYVDGAHNPESVLAVVRAVASHLRPDSMVVVFGCAADKDVARMLPGIASGADKVIFTRADSSERSMDPRDLARKFSEISSRMCQTGATLRDALNLAQRAVGRGRGDIILVTGSFLMAGQAKRMLLADRSSVVEVKPRRE